MSVGAIESRSSHVYSLQAPQPAGAASSTASAAPATTAPVAGASASSGAAQVFDSLTGSIVLGYQSATANETLALGQDAASAGDETDASETDSVSTAGEPAKTTTATTRDSSVDDILAEISGLLGNYPQSSQVVSDQYKAFAANSQTSSNYTQTI